MSPRISDRWLVRPRPRQRQHDPSFSRSLDAYDAQGGAHRGTMSFFKTDANSWQTELFAVPASDVATTNGLLANGILSFSLAGTGLQHPGLNSLLPGRRMVICADLHASIIGRTQGRPKQRQDLPGNDCSATTTSMMG